jgi:hypothetical protein
LFAIVRLDAAVGFGAFGKVFKITNIKTEEIKALKAKAITIISRRISAFNPKIITVK